MVESTPSGAAAWEDDEDWELVNEDGFVFKRRKKRRVDPSADSSLRAPPSASAADLQEDAEKLRRERKKKSLLKLKTQYQAEIDQWELLSSTLRAVEERTCHLQEQQQQHRLNEQEREKTASLAGSGPSELQGAESVCGSVVDELLLQVKGHFFLLVLQLFSWWGIMKIERFWVLGFCKARNLCSTTPIRGSVELILAFLHLPCGKLRTKISVISQ